MIEKSFPLESLLETHELPFVIINASLAVVAVNWAWEVYFGIFRDQQIGKTCCLDNTQCRHKRIFDNQEPYAGLFTNEFAEQEESQQRVRGHPLLDEDGT